MSEFKGTKGKWLLSEGNKDTFTKIVIGENKVLEFQYKTTDWKTEIHDAKLISCATEMLNEMEETVIDLKILRNQIADALKTNHLFEGMLELIDKWIERREQLIQKATS